MEGTPHTQCHRDPLEWGSPPYTAQVRENVPHSQGLIGVGEPAIHNRCDPHAPFGKGSGWGSARSGHGVRHEEGSVRPPPLPARGRTPPGPAPCPGLRDPLTREGSRRRGRKPGPGAGGAASSSSPPSASRGKEAAAHPPACCRGGPERRGWSRSLAGGSDTSSRLAPLPPSQGDLQVSAARADPAKPLPSPQVPPSRAELEEDASRHLPSHKPRLHSSPEHNWACTFDGFLPPLTVIGSEGPLTDTITSPQSELPL